MYARHISHFFSFYPLFERKRLIEIGEFQDKPIICINSISITAAQYISLPAFPHFSDFRDNLQNFLPTVFVQFSFV